MKKLNNKAGFTLMEMLVSIFVLVLLVMGIGTSMDSGLQVYKTSNLNANSGILADIINTSLDDLLRYAEVEVVDSTKPTYDAKDTEEIGFLFTSRDFGMVGAHFVLGTDGILKMQGRAGEDGTLPAAVELVNGGSYSDLKITQFSITYVPKGSTMTVTRTDGRKYNSTEGGFFFVDYKIENQLDKTQVRSVQTVVRLLNAE